MFETTLKSGRVIRNASIIDYASVLNKTSKSPIYRNKANTVNQGIPTGFKKSYDEGYKAGLREGQEKAQKELADAVSALRNIVFRYRTKEETLLQSLEQNVFKLAIDISEKIIGSEVKINRDVVLSVIKKSLALIGGTPRITIKMNPDDLDTVKAHIDEFKNEFSDIKSWRIEPSNAVDLGGCVIETNDEMIDARIQQMMAQMKSNLLEDMDNSDDA